MKTGIRLSLWSQNDGTPAEFEVRSSALKTIYKEWMFANKNNPLTILLDPGVYVLRIKPPSGEVSEDIAQIRDGEFFDHQFFLDSFSPHEAHEWAYVTQPLKGQAAGCLSEKRYQGIWMRLWKRRHEGGWVVDHISIPQESYIDHHEDGVSYTFQQQTSDHLYALQVGGPFVPWKITALPPSYTTMVLIRPAAGPRGRVHPLDVIVSSENLHLQSLLTLIQEGKASASNSLVEQAGLAERFLFEKYEDPAAATIGGYFLLKVNDLSRLHNWADNLANRFEWLPDGAIIHAWQLIAQYRSETSRSTRLLDQAQDRLMQAIDRGFPLYTEGLRLLREGLLFFNQYRESKDPAIEQAIERMGKYFDVTNWTVTSISFTGVEPDMPSKESRLGTPVDKDNLVYIFDVPIREAVRRGILKVGDRFTSKPPWGEASIIVNHKGQLELPGGRTFHSLEALEKELSKDSEGAWFNWEGAERSESTTPQESLRQKLDLLHRQSNITTAN
jgi:hypothetical protein